MLNLKYTPEGGDLSEDETPEGEDSSESEIPEGEDSSEGETPTEEETPSEGGNSSGVRGNYSNASLDHLFNDSKK